MQVYCYVHTPVWAWEAKKHITFQLDCESELRFETDIEENERRLKKVLPAGAKLATLEQPSFVGLDINLRPRLAKNALISAVSRALSQ